MKTNVYLSGALLLVLLALFLLILPSTFIVSQREQAVITRLNKPVRIILGDMPDEQFQTIRQEIIDTARGTSDMPDLIVDKGAGLYFKVPFVDAVNRFPDTLLSYDAEPEDIILADKKKLIVDNFARWRIENPLLYWIRVRDEVAARGALDDIIYSVVREELGRNELIEVIRTSNRPQTATAAADQEAVAGGEENPMRENIRQGREAIMKSVTTRANDLARKQYGIRVADVRIKRADLLRENLVAVFGRMTAERSRISKGYRSDGGKQAEIIKSDTDKRVQVILANAKGEASTVKGSGDAQVLRIFAEAFNTNTDLYRFMRSLEVMQESTPEGSELIIGLNSSIYSLMKPK